MTSEEQTTLLALIAGLPVPDVTRELLTTALCGQQALTEALRTERDALLEALKRYGRHDAQCPSALIEAWCTCGYSSAFAATKEKNP